jgi:hypothetical protein
MHSKIAYEAAGQTGTSAQTRQSGRKVIMHTILGENDQHPAKSRLRNKKKQRSRLHVRQILERICAKHHGRLNNPVFRNNDSEQGEADWHGEFIG